MRPNLITRLKEEWNNLDPVDPLRGLIADAIDALAEQPAQRQPLAGLLSIARRHPDGQVVTVSFKTLDAAIGFERYALDVAHGIKGNT